MRGKPPQPITKESVGLPNEPNYDYEVDHYDVNSGYDSTINYSTLRTISPKMSKLLWSEVDKDLLHEMRYFIHNVQKGWEVKYGLIESSEYVVPEPVLTIRGARELRFKESIYAPSTKPE